jgi:hypothetical protein
VQDNLVCNPLLFSVDDFIVAVDGTWWSGEKCHFSRELDHIV